MNRILTAALAVFTGTLTVIASANAAVSPEQAARLKGDLTPVGAERASNADGTIPAWTGGYTAIPPGYTQGQQRADPFADEKPLLQASPRRTTGPMRTD